MNIIFLTGERCLLSIILKPEIRQSKQSLQAVCMGTASPLLGVCPPGAASNTLARTKAAGYQCHHQHSPYYKVLILFLNTLSLGWQGMAI